jgi:hypothetical protein
MTSHEHEYNHHGNLGGAGLMKRSRPGPPCGQSTSPAAVGRCRHRVAQRRPDVPGLRTVRARRHPHRGARPRSFVRLSPDVDQVAAAPGRWGSRRRPVSEPTRARPGSTGGDRAPPARRHRRSSRHLRPERPFSSAEFRHQPHPRCPQASAIIYTHVPESGRGRSQACLKRHQDQARRGSRPPPVALLRLMVGVRWRRDGRGAAVAVCGALPISTARAPGWRLVALRQRRRR